MLSIHWRYLLHQRPGVTAFSPQRCLVACRNTKLVCLCTLTGIPIWEVSVYNPWGWMALADHLVFYLNQHNLLQTFYTENGQMSWSRQFPGIFGWIHAASGCVVLGGWRGYTDILCLDSSDGKTRWSLPANNRMIYRSALVEPGICLVAWMQESTVSFYDLEDGREIHRLFLPGSWTQSQFDVIPTSSSDSWNGLPASIFLPRSDNSIYRLQGPHWNAEVVSLEFPIKSLQLEEFGGALLYQSRTDELISLNLITKAQKNLGALRHNRRNLLPSITLADGKIVCGTSFGEILIYDKNGYLLMRHTIGKRIHTNICYSSNHLCFGTASGELLGVQII